jgi:predicted RNase H-like HicB family nuclease
MSLFIIKAEWDAEAQVWVAESDDVPGLAAEAKSIEALRPKILAMIADLIEENDMKVDGDDIAIHIIARSTERMANPKAA